MNRSRHGRLGRIAVASSLLAAVMGGEVTAASLVVSPATMDAAFSAPPAGATLLGDGLGIHIAWKQGDAQALTDMRQALDDGYAAVRLDVWKQWTDGIPRGSNGAWDFSRYDQFVQLVRAYPGRTLHLLVYASTAPTPGELASREWEEFCRQLQDWFRADPVRFEVWNEPNYLHFWQGGSDTDFTTYRALLDQCLSGFSAGAAARGLAPRPVCSAGVIYNGWNQAPVATYINGYLGVGGHVPDATMQAIGLHPYRWFNGLAPESRATDHAAFVQARDAAGDGRPFWITENGYPSTMFNVVGDVVVANTGSGAVRLDHDGHAAVALGRQAVYNVRAALMEWLLGNPVDILYQLRDAGTVATDSESNFGAYFADGTIRPAGLAQRQLLAQVRDRPLRGVATLDAGSTLMALKIGSVTAPGYVLWVGRRGHAARLTLALPAGRSASACDLYGVPTGSITATSSAQNWTIDLSEQSGPVYVATWVQAYRPGDVTGDGIIDGADLAALLQQFGRIAGDTGWAVQVDQVADGRIDALDLGAVSSRLGQ